jgi:hypothetical protein
MRPHSSANIAELILASAGHMVASLILLNPELTLIALLKSTSSNELHKRFIHFLFFILFTSKSLMLFNSAIQTISFSAD